MSDSSMVVNNFNIQRITVEPTKAHAILIVDTDAVLAGTIALECFEPIARRHAQKVECRRRVQLRKLASRHFFDSDEPSHPVPVEQGFGVLVGKGFDHEHIVYRYTIYRNDTHPLSGSFATPARRAMTLTSRIDHRLAARAGAAKRLTDRLPAAPARRGAAVIGTQHTFPNVPFSGSN